MTRDRELVRRSNSLVRQLPSPRPVLIKLHDVTRRLFRRNVPTCIQRLSSLAAVSVHREGLQSELRALAVCLHDVLDRRVFRHIDRLRDRARQEGLNCAHHADMTHPVDRADTVLRAECAVEDRQMLVL